MTPTFRIANSNVLSFRRRKHSPPIWLQVYRDISQVSYQCRQRILRHRARDSQIQQGDVFISFRHTISRDASRQIRDGRRRGGKRLLWRTMRNDVRRRPDGGTWGRIWKDREAGRFASALPRYCARVLRDRTGDHVSQVFECIALSLELSDVHCGFALAYQASLGRFHQVS